MENRDLCFGDMPINELMHQFVDESADDTLTHYGIRGMKWGFRRYQNKDGSLTAAGKKRYNQELSKVRAAEKVLKTKLATKSKIEKLGERKKAVADGEQEIESFYSKDKSKKGSKSADSTASKKKTLGDMSDDELRQAINRMQLEKQFMSLQSELHPKKVSAGKEFVKKLGKNLGDATAEAVKNAGKSFMEKKLKEALGLNDAKTKSAYEKLKEEVEMLDMQKRYNDHKKDNSLQTRANNTNLKKQMLENEKRIKALEKEAKAKPDKTAEKLSKLKREKDQYEMQRQIEALEKLKANNWKDPKKDKDNK